MVLRGSLLLIFLFLSSCSLYSSAGRKQFEDKAPGSIQSFALLGCRDLSAAETWLKEEFPSNTHELVELHPDYEVWGRRVTNGQVEIMVLSKNDGNTTESCVYQFESAKAWSENKKAFLNELSRSLVTID